MEPEPADHQIPPQSVAVLVWNAIAHLNFLTGPREITAVAGRDAWLAALLGIALIALTLWVSLRVLALFPGKTLVEIAQTLLGRTVGLLVGGGYVAYWLGVAAYLVQGHAHVVAVTLLPETPRWVPNLYPLLVVTYLVSKGLETMVRLFLLLLPAYVLPLAFLIGGGAVGADLGRLRPVLAQGLGPLLHGTWVSFAQAYSISTLWIAGPFLTRPRGSVKAAMAGLGLIAAPAVALVLVLLARLGPLEVTSQTFPTTFLLELVEIPGFTGFRVDAAFLAIWVVMVLSSVALLHFAAAESLRRLLHLRGNRWPVLGTALAVAVLSSLPFSQLDLARWGQTVLLYAVTVAALGFPTLLWALAGRHGPASRGRAGR